VRRGGATAALAALLAAALSGCVPDDPAPVWVGPLEGCTCDPATYPCGDGEFGTETCDVMCDLSFEAANDAAEDAGSEDLTMALHDLYADESVAGILVFGTAGWCQFCGQEGAWLAQIYEQYQDIDGAGRRVEMLAVVFQDDYGNPATREYAAAYADRRGFPFPAVADPTGGVLRYFDPASAPGNVFVERCGMQIRQVIQGFDQAAIEQGLRALDGTCRCQ
jgi:hypothetical protein